ncbi:MAG: alanine racemase [Bacteroidales bacterium]
MLSEPTLIVNKEICRANIKNMAQKAQDLGIKLRPHFKTHQSHTIGRWFRNYGITSIAVSSPNMAQYFADDGWSDITIAFPFIPDQSDAINSLAKKVELQVTVSSLGNAIMASQSILSKMSVLIEIDSGQGRSGVNSNDSNEINSIISILLKNQNVNFLGFLTHAGQSYQLKPNQLPDFNNNICKLLSSLKRNWITDFPNLIISYGDTPTSVICNSFQGMDELRPGNFIFFDMQQANQGVCSTSDIAIALAVPLVSVYADKLKAIVWGGAVHLSKDFYIDTDGNKSFGAVCKLHADLTWSEPIQGVYLESVSQEHGVIKAQDIEAFKRIENEEHLAILPAHSCLAVHSMRELWIDGYGKTPTL